MSTFESLPTRNLAFKRFLIHCLTGVAVFMTISLIFCAMIDPFNFYHSTEKENRYTSPDQRFSRPAILQAPQYDSYILGGSMSQLFPIPELNNILGGNFAHLTFSGATSFELRNALHALPRHQYKSLLLEIYFASFTDNTQAIRYASYPEYLYDRNRWNDIRAYMYLDAFMIQELYRAISYNYLGADKRPSDERSESNGFFNWEKGRTWEETSARQRIDAAYELVTTHEQKYSTENFRQILKDLPKFQQVFVYFPPISAVSLKSRTLRGHPNNLPNYLAWKREIMELALTQPNVVLIDYQTINRHTSDIQNYWDYNHFRSRFHRMIMEDIQSIQHHGRLKHAHFGRIVSSGDPRSLTLEFQSQMRTSS